MQTDPLQLTQMQGALQLVSTIATVVATVAIAFFTGLVWLLNRRQHQLTYQATLNVVEKQARFKQSTKEVRVELVLNNTSLVPAILHEWSVLIRDGDFQESISDGALGETKLVNIPRFVGGRWWAVERGRPTAFSLRATLPRNVSNRAWVHVRLAYFGGRHSVTNVEEDIPVETAP